MLFVLSQKNIWYIAENKLCKVPIISNFYPDCTIFLFNPKPPSIGFFMNHDLAICLSVVFDHIRYKGEKRYDSFISSLMALQSFSYK